jgi:hypothetical protein
MPSTLGRKTGDRRMTKAKTKLAPVTRGQHLRDTPDAYDLVRYSKGSPDDDGNPSIKVRLASPGTLKEVFGSDSPAINNALLRQTIRVLGDKERDGINDSQEFMTAIIREIAPQDAVERMLALQVAATHIALTRHAGYLANNTDVDVITALGNGYNKLARTYVLQMEALRKHRNGGHSKVTVEHVTVNEGGQAIVGNVEGRGGSGKS